jgi:hypothetical protein
LKADAITAWADATLEPARAAKAAADGVDLGQPRRVVTLTLRVSQPSVEKEESPVEPKFVCGIESMNGVCSACWSCRLSTWSGRAEVGACCLVDLGYEGCARGGGQQPL